MWSLESVRVSREMGGRQGRGDWSGVPRQRCRSRRSWQRGGSPRQTSGGGDTADTSVHDEDCGPADSGCVGRMRAVHPPLPRRGDRDHRRRGHIGTRQRNEHEGDGKRRDRTYAWRWMDISRCCGDLDGARRTGQGAVLCPFHGGDGVVPQSGRPWLPAVWPRGSTRRRGQSTTEDMSLQAIGCQSAWAITQTMEHTLSAFSPHINEWQGTHHAMVAFAQTVRVIMDHRRTTKKACVPHHPLSRRPHHGCDATRTPPEVAQHRGEEETGNNEADARRPPGTLTGCSWSPLS
jgi:hypothetical protein